MWMVTVTVLEEIWFSMFSSVRKIFVRKGVINMGSKLYKSA